MKLDKMYTAFERALTFIVEGDEPSRKKAPSNGEPTDVSGVTQLYKTQKIIDRGPAPSSLYKNLHLH